jgi:Na+-translocating ferredoxin:NAD+ oxidoreductase RnfC subunit
MYGRHRGHPQRGRRGEGGAGFPTHVKLNVSAGRVIVNGAECEPLLRWISTPAHAGGAVVRGLMLAMEAAHAEEGVIATKNALRRSRRGAEGRDRGRAPHPPALMESYYPSGDEKNVIFEVTAVVPTGRLPSTRAAW